MGWSKPFELTYQEYNDTYNAIKTELFEVARTEDGIFTSRKGTKEIVLAHFYVNKDAINYWGANEKDTYYQLDDIPENEYKAFEDLNTRITLSDPMAVQIFMNEVIRLQNEYYAKEEGENSDEVDSGK